MKFEIFKSDKNDEFYFRLKASNGRILLMSEGYKARSGCENGIESVRKNAGDEHKFEFKEARNDQWFFHMIAANGLIIGRSQLYDSKAVMKHAIESVMNGAPEAKVEEVSE